RVGRAAGDAGPVGQTRFPRRSEENQKTAGRELEEIPMTMRLVGWAIIHSLWQGGVIALVTAGLLAATRKAKPVVRYAISLFALVMMVALPIVSAAISTSTSESQTGSISNFSFNLSPSERASSPTSSA